MFENPSSIDEIIGSLTPEEKDQAFLEITKRFKDQGFEPNLERAKTTKEMQSIESANEITNQVLEKYRIEKFNVPQKNIHIIDNDDVWVKYFNEDFVGAFLQESQVIVIRDAEWLHRFESEIQKNVEFKENIIHEMFHFKGYNSLQKTTSDNPQITGFYCGINARSRDGKRDHFNSLNEGITQELTERIMKKLINTNLFTDGEKEYIKENKMSQPYPQETSMVKSITEKIYQKNPDKYQNEDEVFDHFAKSMLTGNLKGITKILRDNFGKGIIQTIESKKEVSEQLKYVESL